MLTLTYLYITVKENKRAVAAGARKPVRAVARCENQGEVWKVVNIEARGQV